MLDFLLIAAQVLGFLGIAVAIALPRTRRRAAIALLALAAAALVAALLAVGSGSEGRSLTVTATFPAYDELLIVPTPFPVDQVTAPAFLWLLLVAVFAGAWALWARKTPSDQTPGPFALPLVLAWTGTALLLLLQKSAAPAVLVQPAGIDRILWPATLAAGLILADRCQRVVHLILYLSLFIALGRLPIAIFSVLASNGGWGTALDISTITLFANPVIQQPIEVLPGSSEQHLWLIWLQHLVMMPGIYMMSTGGIAFSVYLFLKHAPQE